MNHATKEVAVRMEGNCNRRRVRLADGAASDGTPWGTGRSGKVYSSGERPKRGKRLLDLALVGLSIPLLLPLLALIALAIKIEQPSAPVLFRQLRTGLHGRRFRMLKFRTMRPDAEHMLEQIKHLNKRTWPEIKIENDPRVTRVGRVLRATKLDELPQLFNVLRGDMSIVGPRPTSAPPDAYKPEHLPRLDVLPGITGPWQLSQRADTTFDEHMMQDVEYARTATLKTDLLIVVRTVVLMARGRIFD
ncbi:MAG: sugar transferase [Alphaproteobacteria bacterium]|jgi:lipopolysaccharide/colanic/teichoic acid biosynthesis glycosyltransferase|nr:sugar transferase [Alphaproteobacteria bacterium]